ncbi:MAG: hypothetical protein JST17_03770 [Bacteroidetes bacterium]|nr:hypothetical protein [Bacteroidota bacterium]MBS1929527.1 hypothetical protein [Bacteroidota bacterium]
MKTGSTIQSYHETIQHGAIAVWLMTMLLFATGFQRIKEIIAFLLMKLYELFIQRNALKI